MHEKSTWYPLTYALIIHRRFESANLYVALLGSPGITGIKFPIR